MSKRIIYCADGAWDNPEADTNVYKLYKAIPTRSNQTPFYDDGVGVEGALLQKMAGGATGEGIFQKIRDGYNTIALEYEPGDDIFIFGFSRGALVARNLAAMIGICGMPSVEFDAILINTAFKAYRTPDQRAALLDGLKKYALFDAKIKMVGVWDTVGASGVPAITGGVDPVKFGFIDTNLHPDILNAYHALAIDERRMHFPATLWTPPSPPVPGQTLEQVWFPGVHCDVGGGYPETGLSEIALGWMMERAKDLGVQFANDAWSQYVVLNAGKALDEIHDSSSSSRLPPKLRAVANDATLDKSVALRCESDTSYKPQNLLFSEGKLVSSHKITQAATPTPSAPTFPNTTQFFKKEQTNEIKPAPTSGLNNVPAESKATLEERGREFAVQKLKYDGYEAELMGLDNPGFDLRARKDGKTLKVKVKSHEREADGVFITQRECEEYLKAPGPMETWELWNIENLAMSLGKLPTIQRIGHIPESARKEIGYWVDLSQCSHEPPKAAAPEPQ